jgi:hypothetical protein
LKYREPARPRNAPSPANRTTVNGLNRRRTEREASRRRGSCRSSPSLMIFLRGLLRLWCGGLRRARSGLGRWFGRCWRLRRLSRAGGGPALISKPSARRAPGAGRHRSRGRDGTGETSSFGNCLLRDHGLHAALSRKRPKIVRAYYCACVNGHMRQPLLIGTKPFEGGAAAKKIHSPSCTLCWHDVAVSLHR